MVWLLPGCMQAGNVYYSDHSVLGNPCGLGLPLSIHPFHWCTRYLVVHSYRLGIGGYLRTGILLEKEAFFTCPSHCFTIKDTLFICTFPSKVKNKNRLPISNLLHSPTSPKAPLLLPTYPKKKSTECRSYITASLLIKMKNKLYTMTLSDSKAL